jgi:ribonuclease T2
MLSTVIMMLSVAAMAEAKWTVQNEQACDGNTPGQFKYYTLSLSWSPEFCRSHPENKEPQCRQYREFVVHGLWPECASGSPQNCGVAGPVETIDKERIYIFMPSDFLIRHEWDKHGTCSGLGKSAYFGLTGHLFGKLKLPRLSGAPKPEKIKALFMQNNPGLDDGEFYLSCAENGTKKSGKTLDEVRICFEKDTQEFTRCEAPRDTCRKLKRVTVTRAK